MPAPWFRLHYTENHFRFEWDSPKAEVFWLDEHGMRELENLYQDWLSAVQPRPWFAADPEQVTARTHKLRQRMSELAPPELRSWFRDFPTILADDRSGLPWELLCEETVLLQRKLSGSSSDLRLNPPFRGLMLSDPDGTMPWTAVPELPNLRRLDAGRAGWQQLIESGTETDWLWLSAGEVRGQLVLGNSLLGFEDALCRSLQKVPPLVVLQLYPIEANASPLWPRLMHWARFLGEAGARVVLARLFPSPGAEVFVQRLHRHFLQLKDLAQALRKTRIETNDPVEARSWLWLGEGNLLLSSPRQAATAASSLRPDFQLTVIAGPDLGRRFPIMLQEGRQFHLGKAGVYSNEIELTDLEIDNRALRLEVEAGQLIVRNLTKDPGRASVNRLGLRDALALEGGETLQLGESWLVLERFRSFLGSSKPATYQLRWSEQSFPVRDSITTIGRGENCKLCLEEPSISRLHATLNLRDDDYVLVPLSSNPTVVNGVVLDRERVLEAGDQIQLADSVLLTFERCPA
ncbi:MAG: FHA domain-containing protein [Candidatus Eremiobacteraeota bacterium]|nr:FHA domain-containing protein [Candidatus Eremiobacteraeota bacterium]MCW5870633.1 FHA domain-containing protein [Candidatus Eremiobacteraeota bacterium]